MVEIADRTTEPRPLPPAVASRASGGVPHVVIVGAGFGGLNATRALKGAPVRITVVDRRNHHLFQPLLYQVATAGLSPGEIAYPIRAALRHQKNAQVLLADVTGVDLAARKLRFKDGGEIGYDYLILATGATDNYFGHDDWQPWAPGLKSLEEALEIRRRILLAFERAERETDAARRQELLTFVLVGAGPTGVELAGAIAEIALHVMAEDFRSIDPRESRIILVEAGPRVLPAFPPELSAKAEAALTKMGVEVLTSSMVTAIGPDAVMVGKHEIRTATTIWSAGVKASPLVKMLGAPVDRAGRVLVAPTLTIPDHSEVFVIGDAAAFLDGAGKPLPGVAPVAIQQGRHVARNIVRAAQGKPLDPFHYFNKGNLATIGRAAGVADFGRLRLSGFVAWVTWLLVHIFFLIGFRNRLVVMFDWMWSYFFYGRAARLITGIMNDES
ncbi:MAG: NAD(P)/FAD-dependent oxidoreductase [Terriglobia bacterium]